MSRTLDELDAERIADDIEIASWEEEEETIPQVQEEKEEDPEDPTVDDLETDYQEALNVLSDVRLLLEDLTEPQYNWRLPDGIRKRIHTTLEEVESYLDSVDEGEETEL